MLSSILTGPVKGLMFIARKVDESVQQDRKAQIASTMAELRRLHKQFEAGEIPEDDFDVAEEKLLDYLDELKSDE